MSTTPNGWLSDPVMLSIVGRESLDRTAASTTQIGHLEPERLANGANLAALAGLCRAWIDRVHDHKPPKSIILDIDNSVSPT